MEHTGHCPKANDEHLPCLCDFIKHVQDGAAWSIANSVDREITRHIDNLREDPNSDYLWGRVDESIHIYKMITGVDLGPLTTEILNKLDRQKLEKETKKVIKQADRIVRQKWLSTKEAAIYTGMSARWISKMISVGKLPSVKVAGARRIERVELDRLMRSVRA